jgi:cysteine desulfurase/selenocysteine lyase
MDKKLQLLDPLVIRKDFPILSQKVNNRPLVYFDNSATTQKPQVVIDALTRYYSEYNANVHRGVHHLSMLATNSFEAVRENIRSFINARNNYEIVYTRGTTESINLIASSWGRKNVHKGDEILLTELEHHSNIVPWQILCEEKEAKIKVLPINDDGTLNLEVLPEMLTEKTKLLSLTHVSNSLGTINPVKEIIETAHKNNTLVLLDGAQALSHMMVDVVDLDCDFYTFSAHKMYGPMGIGGFYGKEHLLDEMPPYQGGGEMIRSVSFDKTVYNELPFKFEAGTPNVGGAIAFGAAIDYIKEIGIENIASYEKYLLEYLTDKLESDHSIRILGTAPEKTSVVSFLVDKIHPYDTGTIFDQLGIAVRTGNHCTQPLMDRLQVLGTVRASMAFYNTTEEIDRLLEAIDKVKQLFQ